MSRIEPVTGKKVARNDGPLGSNPGEPTYGKWALLVALLAQELLEVAGDRVRGR